GPGTGGTARHLAQRLATRREAIRRPHHADPPRRMGDPVMALGTCYPTESRRRPGFL
ncbi:MAG: hypothetical protein AVDCRST_MAG49-1243, partial [uncultured Thermomicrobiales bacterium]